MHVGAYIPLLTITDAARDANHSIWSQPIEAFHGLALTQCKHFQWQIRGCELNYCELN